jgi:hypothetical protein
MNRAPSWRQSCISQYPQGYPSGINLKSAHISDTENIKNVRCTILQGSVSNRGLATGLQVETKESTPVDL